MKRKSIIGMASIVLLLALICYVYYEGGVLGARRTPNENELEVEAYYYTNRTGKSSKFISYKECEEVGNGTIFILKDADAMEIRNAPDEVDTYLNEIPDYSGYIGDNEDIRWMTIYRSRGVYRVIGEVVEAEPVEAESAEAESDDFLLLLDEDGSAEYEDRGIPEEGMAPDEFAEEIIEEEPVVEAIIEEPKIPDEYDTVSDLVGSEVTSGMTVTTRGYYSADDGGEGTYAISDTKGKVYESLNSGLYANLQYDDSINIRLLGAKGNGSDDDSSYLEKAFTLGVSEVVIPEGEFNLSGKAITVPKGVSITGINRETSILKNLCLTAPNGITMSNITCDGAAKRKVLTPAERLTNAVMIDVSPKGSQSVSYSNCIFKNADIASFAFAKQDGKFARDEVTDCIFENMGRVAVYHSTNSDFTRYFKNSFSEIGNTSITYGPVSAIWIGDVTNNTYTKSKEIIIDDNRFENLYTADDFNSVHALNANFICIRGDYAEVTNNHVENLYGYGSDRESIYTKVSRLKIDNNTIINGGYGEGYICNKGVEGNLFAEVTNNKFYGEYGCGIRQYGPAKINGNVIEIQYCPSAIIMTARGDQTDASAIEVCNNEIRSGTDGTYFYNGKEVTSYSAGKLISIVGTIGDSTIADNKVYPGTSYESCIAVGNARGNVLFDHNEIDSIGKKGTSISVYNNSKGKVNPEQSITFRRNILSVLSGQKSISVNMVSQSTKRLFMLDSNEYTFSNETSWNYPMSIIISGKNDDTLEVIGNKTNSIKKRTSIAYAPNTFINNDENFATYTKR